MQGFISLSILRKDSKMYSWQRQCHHLQHQLPLHILGFCLNLNSMACTAGSCSHSLHCAVLSHDQLFATLWTVVCQAPLSMGFSRQESWSGLPCPPPELLHDPGIELAFPALQVDSLPSEPPGNFLITLRILSSFIIN